MAPEDPFDILERGETMKIQNRREFLQISASIAPMSLIAAAGVTASSSAAPAAEKGMRLGLIIGVGKDPEAAMKKVHDLGLPTFPELTMPYIGPILMHTGIPNYCLEDYFLLVSQRRATDPELDPESFLTWAIGRPHRLDTLDKLAQTFLALDELRLGALEKLRFGLKR